MGIHLSIVDSEKNFQKVSMHVWDWMRHAGDSELYLSVSSWKYLEADETIYFRPTHLEDIRAFGATCRYNKDRWLQLYNLLHENPNYWLRISL